MKLDRRITSIVRFLNVSTAAQAIGLAAAIGLCVAVPAHAQTDPAECERLFFRPAVIIATTFNHSTSFVISADLDGDGDSDVLLAYYGTIAWYENTDGLGSFGPQHVIAQDVDRPWSLFAADLDGDGDTDVLSAFTGDDKIAWYENTNGLGTFGPQRVITDAAHGAWSVFAADFDGDGDIDVVSTSGADKTIAWYKNTDGLGTFGPQQVITTDVDGPWSIFAADLDGDGDMDVLSASENDNKIAWYENIDGRGAFGPQRVITSSAAGARSVFAADLDGDGDTDVLTASRVGDMIGWHENTDGLGTFGPRQVIASDANGASSVIAADLDGDGDNDVIWGSYSTIAWQENTNGLGEFGRIHALTTRAGGVPSIFAIDLEGDGDTDIIAAFGEPDRDDKIVWYENESDCNGNGVNDRCDIADGISLDCNHTARPDECDLDDGISADCNFNEVPDECDVLDGTSTDCNGNGQPDECDLADGTGLDCNFNDILDECEFETSFATRVVTTAADGTRSVFAADLDGDGDIDVLTASKNDDKIAWYENTNGMGAFGPQQIITSNADGARSVFAADLDGDGDIDVLSASENDGKIAWYENTDGKGLFGPHNVIAADATNAAAVFATDLDGDGDVDVLSVSRGSPPRYDSTVAWYENTDGKGSFSQQHAIPTTIRHAESVSAADLDGDGDPDVLSASVSDSDIVWYKNIDGLGTFAPERTVTNVAYGPFSVFAADLDGDGDNDVLAATSFDNKIAWYPNVNGLGTFGWQRVITTSTDRPRFVLAADLDGDGDADVLSVSLGAPRIAWYENTDGRGTFGPPQVIDNAVCRPHSAFAADLDGDGNTDVLSASFCDGKIAWYENLGGGRDCNDNDVPDECDIADGLSEDCDGSDVPDECEPFGGEDVDGDGVVELCDLCPDSQLGRTLILNGCDTNVPEMVIDDGCTMADLLDECNGDARNHGDYVSCVTYVAREWKHDGVITGREFGRIVSCAAKPRTSNRRAIRKDDDGHK